MPLRKEGWGGTREDRVSVKYLEQWISDEQLIFWTLLESVMQEIAFENMWRSRSCVMHDTRSVVFSWSRSESEFVSRDSRIPFSYDPLCLDRSRSRSLAMIVWWMYVCECVVHHTWRRAKRPGVWTAKPLTLAARAVAANAYMENFMVLCCKIREQSDIMCQGEIVSGRNATRRKRIQSTWGWENHEVRVAWIT